MDVAKQPVSQYRSHPSVRLLFEQVKERGHRIANGFPSRRHVARGPEVDRIVPVPGERLAREQPSDDAGLKELAYQPACALRTAAPGFLPSKICEMLFFTS